MDCQIKLSIAASNNLPTDPVGNASGSRMKARWIANPSPGDRATDLPGGRSV
jgi:hypothetical protein